MTRVITRNELERIAAQAGGVLAQGGKVVNRVDAATVLELVDAYKIAQFVKRSTRIPWHDHDMELLKVYLNQLPD